MRRQGGGASQVEPYSKAVGYAYAIFKWDPVTQLAGVLNGPASGLTAGTTRLVGVSTGWSPASTAATLLILDHPFDLFEAQGDGSDASLMVAASMGYNANLNYSGTAGGGETRDNSGVQVTETTIAVTATLDVRVLRLLNEVDNAYGAYGRLELRINKHLNNAEVTAT